MFRILEDYADTFLAFPLIDPVVHLVDTHANDREAVPVALVGDELDEASVSQHVEVGLLGPEEYWGSARIEALDELLVVHPTEQLELGLGLADHQVVDFARIAIRAVTSEHHVPVGLRNWLGVESQWVKVDWTWH